jgi:uncharacterized protein
MPILSLDASEPLAAALTAAIHRGDVDALQTMLASNPDLANARVVDPRGGQRTPLHLVADWPGYFPNAPAVVQLLIAAGADPNAPMLSSNHRETPLHWAASSDDVEVARALIDGGADLEASGASIAGGTPLDDAVGYACWHVARLLVARGARVDKLWHAAALGLLDRSAALLASATPPTQAQINQAFWHACAGGQRRAAELLLAYGADPRWVPEYSKWGAVEVAAQPDTARAALIDWLHSQGL